MDSINIKDRDGFVFNDMLAASQLREEHCCSNNWMLLIFKL